MAGLLLVFRARDEPRAMTGIFLIAEIAGCAIGSVHRPT
jgi:hypothetical protein